MLNTEDFPLTVMDRPIESETTKIVENSYRATILAFLNEWSLFAERNGVDLIKVIQAIKMRPTHSNIIFPGPGIGGYCLPKDGGLGYWAYKHILGFEDGDASSSITPTAIDINDTRGLHVAELTRDALRNMGRYIAGADVLHLRRQLPPGRRRHALQRLGDGRPQAHRDGRRACASTTPTSTTGTSWRTRTTYPAPGHSLGAVLPQPGGPDRTSASRRTCRRPSRAPRPLILAVPHKPYLELDPEQVVEWAGGPLAVIDCFGILTDEQIRRYFELGCEVKALGRGHIQRIKEEVRRARAK